MKILILCTILGLECNFSLFNEEIMHDLTYSSSSEAKKFPRGEPFSPMFLIIFSLKIFKKWAACSYFDPHK